jgi:iron-sulfur cluster assembly protein
MLEPVTLTQKAAVEVRSIMKNKNIPEDYALRIGVKGGGGCGGVQYVLGFDKPKPEDLQYHQQEIPMVVEKKHTMYLLGLQVDFYEGNEARGFMFTKPEEEVESRG